MSLGRTAPTILSILLAIWIFPLTAFSQDESSQDGDKADRRQKMRQAAQKRMSDPKYDPIHGQKGNGPERGDWAPDFSLTPLKFYELKTETKDITVENAEELYSQITLSQFRDKMPVALIFGSYT